MIKAILFFLIAAIATSFIIPNDQCPHDLEVLCIDDINVGIHMIIQLTQLARKLLNPREKTYQLI